MTKKMTMASEELRRKLDVAPFSAIDRQFARYLMMRCKAEPLTALAGAMTTAILASGHSCLDLEERCKTPWGDDEALAFELPNANEWIRALECDPAVGVPGDSKPLILVHDRIGSRTVTRLYLFKYFNFEKRVADRLRAMCTIDDAKVPEPAVALAKALFADEKDLSAFGGQLQTAGAFVPFFSRFSIITGGPGTGKTTVLASILALLCASAKVVKGDGRKTMGLSDLTFPTIQLAAPTGKAAQRMGESIRKAAGTIRDEEIKQHLSALIPSTIHRLLGLYGDSPKPKRNQQSPIDADIVVIDEASMMDISQFARLIDALPPQCRLILLGDRHQLASVQAGCVMADICTAFTPNTFSKAFAAAVNRAIVKPENRIKAVADGASLSPVVELQYSYRFQDCKPIGVVSKAVNSGSADDTIAAISALQGDDEYCRLAPYPGSKEMADIILNEYRPLFDMLQPETALAQLQRFMVLTVLNEGPFGREGINQQVYRSYGATPPVRPIKITENSIPHKLFNGDMGVIIRATGADGETVERAWFPFIAEGEAAGAGETAGAAEDHSPRQFLVGALPAFVDAFAITIHNSQGSEFEKVAVVLPSRDTQILTRELLYTGITRAKTRAAVYGSEELVRTAVGREIDRHSGLAERLNGCD